MTISSTVGIAAGTGSVASRSVLGDGRGLRTAAGPTLIGLEICPRALHAAQLTGRRGAARLSAGLSLARAPHADPSVISEAEAHDLALSMMRAGFVGTQVVLGARDEMLMTGVLELPPRSSKAPVDEIARHELARMHRADPESFVFAHWDLPASERAKTATHAMGLALPFDACDASIDALQSAGLQVIAVEPRMCALARACAASIGGMNGLVGLVEVGHSATQVLLLHASGSAWTLVYERRIGEVTLGQLMATLQQKLSLDEDAAMLALNGGAMRDDVDPKLVELVRVVRRHQSEFFDRLVPEVQRSFAYATQRHPTQPMTHLYLCGSGALVRGLRTRLSQQLSLECAPLLPETCAELHDGSMLGRECGLVCAMGLACFDSVHALRASVPQGGLSA